MSLISVGVPAMLAAAAPAGSDRGAVEQVIQQYFRSGDENDVAALESAFHATLGMYWVKDGRPLTLARSAWAERLRSSARPDPATLRRVDSLELTGDLATARLHSEFRTHQFEDLVTLQRVGGRWRIVLKVFHRREPADAPRPSSERRTEDEQAVRAMVAEMFRALETSDGAGLGRTALPRAQRHGLDQGELVAVSFPEWQARLEQARRQGAPSAVRRSITGLELATDVALARVALGTSPNVWSEAVSLLRLDEGWRIVGVVADHP